MQKSFTEDFLEDRSKNNEGELDMYFIENDYEEIVSRGGSEAVQQCKTKS